MSGAYNIEGLEVRKEKKNRCDRFPGNEDIPDAQPELEAGTVQGGVPSGPGLVGGSELGKRNRNSKNRSYRWAISIKLCSAH